MNIEKLYQLFTKNYLVDTDSRNIRKGSIFFALKGENFNGNLFAIKALNLGASFAVIDEDCYELKSDKRLIKVENSLNTLQQLASYHRQKLGLPIVSITGSNGKTTTKELITSVLKTSFNVVSTSGNFNNHIGVPLTLLRMKPSTVIGIVEMGTNHPGEIEQLCNIAKPNFGYITNFGKAHLEGFKSFENIIKEKTALYRYIKNTEGILFINKRDSVQVRESKETKKIDFNKGEITNLKTDYYIKVNYKNVTIQSQLIGNYNFNNIAAAVTIGNYFKIHVENIKMGIENYTPKNNRSQILKKGTNTFILDAYNANPTSMIAALESFSNLPSKNKLVILGDMFELGTNSKQEHQSIAKLAEELFKDKVILIGKAFSTITVKNALQFESFNTFKDSQNYINVNNTSILIKASRGMALERILDLF
ncbi:MAG: UDP-N-acetylmuramoyl-tripeptide--D-alanyl-D-alanine ligase [Lutibacter sp.]